MHDPTELHAATALDWRDGTVPVSLRFDDPYYSLQGGLSETAHVFIGGNDLPARFARIERGDVFDIAELGFGTGLNFLSALQSFRESGATGRLRFTAFEAYPMSMPDLTRALAPFEGLPVDALLGEGHAAGALPPHIDGADFDLHLVVGDANETLPQWAGQADAWFLDGFSPAKNPQMWNAALMAEVGRHTAPDGTFATYTAAGHVRRALADAGFDVSRAPGFGSKRHMSKGILAKKEVPDGSR